MPFKDIKPAVLAIAAKREEYAVLRDYYEGDHELKFSTDKIRKALGKIGIYFAENWLAVVVDAAVDRLSLKGFEVSDSPELTTLLATFFKKARLGLVSTDVHEDATIVGESYFILGKVDGKIQANFNAPELCHIFYESADPLVKKYAAKFWSENNYVYLNLYYPKKIEKYRAPLRKSVAYDALDHQQVSVVPNPTGQIPVFHFRHSQKDNYKIDMGPSERSIQDAINILFSNMMVSSEFNSLKQRIIISQSDPGDLKNIPGENWWFPAGDGTGQQTSVSELGGHDPTGFLTSIDHFANALSATTRTPKYYFFGSEGQVPSGEALLTLEAPLVKKVLRRLLSYSVTWEEIASYAALLMGSVIEPTDITSLWGPIGSVQPLTEAQIIKTEGEATIPLKTSLRRRGWSATEIADMETDKEEQTTKTSLGMAALESLRNKDAEDNTPLEEDEDAG
jgi:hypothetical protein